MALVKIAVVFGLIHFLSLRHVVIRTVSGKEEWGLKKAYGTTKTVKTESGDFYDCVDIYKQPSLSHPLLKNHKIQTRPTFVSKKKIDEASKKGETTLFRRSGTRVLQNICSPGTVPISRTRKKPFPQLDLVNGYHFAGIRTKRGVSKIFRGATATITQYNPKVKPRQSSGAVISVQSGPPYELNYISVGWVVDPDLYGNTLTHLFTRWTADNHVKTGCYNLLCPGFVVVNSSVPIDSVLVNVSDTNGDLYLSPFGIQQDDRGNWWYYFYHNELIPLGYWPKELFTHLANGADYIEMGGQVISPPDTGDSPQMGSGLYTNSYRRTSFFHKISFLNETLDYVIPDNSYMEAVDFRCYLAAIKYDDEHKYNFMFGGPGGKDLTCT